MQFSVFSPLMGPGLVSTSPATISNRESAKKKENRGAGRDLRLRTQPRPRTASLPREERASPPASHMLMATFTANKSSSMRHNWGDSAINRPKFNGTRRRDPLWAWYHRSFRFSHWPIRARHSSTPLGGIFEFEQTALTKSELRFERKVRLVN